jgi:hypothetical protein
VRLRVSQEIDFEVQKIFEIKLAMVNQKDTNGSDRKIPDDVGFVRRNHETERNLPTRRSGPSDQANRGARDGKHGTVERF